MVPEVAPHSPDADRDAAAELRRRLAPQPRRARPRRAPSRRALTVAAVTCLGGAALAGAVVLRTHDARARRISRPRSATQRPPVSTAPPGARRVWPAPPWSFADGVVTIGDSRYGVGRAGDLATVGHWSCRAEPQLALVRPETGEVVVFDRWPASGEQTEGRLVATVEDASSVERADEDGDGCDEIVVKRWSGAVARLDPRSDR